MSCCAPSTSACSSPAQPQPRSRGRPFGTVSSFAALPKPSDALAAQTQRNARAAGAGTTSRRQIGGCVGHKNSSIVPRATAEDGVSVNKVELERELEEKKFPPPEITKSDEQFLKEGCEFVYSADEVDLEDLNELFEKVGFPRRDPDRLKIALEHTHTVLWVRATKKSRWARMGQMLGFARATSDGVFSAIIWDVAVNPAWQRCGLGRGLVERLTSAIVEDDVSAISLYAEPNVVGMYQKLGFQPDIEGVRGMAFQRAKTDKK